jgi:fructokinase
MRIMAQIAIAAASALPLNPMTGLGMLNRYATMIIVIGEILVDQFPDYDRIGGAPFNFAYHLWQLGWPVRFFSRIGNDALGEKIRRYLEQKGFPQGDIQIDPNHPTGKVDVALDSQGVPHFAICDDVAYDYIALPDAAAVAASPVDLIYFGTLARRSPHGFSQVETFLKQTRAPVIQFCDINLRPPHINPAAVAASLKHADLLKLNSEELALVSRLCNGPGAVEDAIEWLLGDHGIDTVAVTRGAQGRSLYSKRATSHSPPVQVAQMVDTVGAGDAYAAVLAAGRLNHLPDAVTLTLATRFAAAICAIPGATPDDAGLYKTIKGEMERIVHAT